MHAAIHQDVDVAVLVARHDGRLRPDRHGLVIAGLRDLALVSEEYPTALEDTLHLKIEDLLLKVNLAMDPAVLDQLFKIQL